MSDEKKPFNNPFGALGGLRSALPEQPAKPEKAKEPPKGPARAVVRLERAGRGHAVARGGGGCSSPPVAEHPEHTPAARAAWLKELKSAMGCGGVLEGEALVLQGDLRERISKWLEKKGVRKVTVAN